MSTLTLSGSRYPDPVSKGHSELGHGLAKGFSRFVAAAWARTVAGVAAMQEQQAEDYAMPCLAQMSPDQLKELGYTPADIKAIDAHRHMTPPYWV